MERLDLKELSSRYRSLLLEDVIPWWQKFGLDPSGAINTCIKDNGEVISRDRWLWSQWRAVWVFSKLYNSVERRDEWLQIAMGIYSFLANNGPFPSGHWPTLLNGNGEVIRGYESIYVDGFAIYALSELYKATGDLWVYDLAMRTFEATERDLYLPEPPPAWPYPLEKGHLAHGISMIFSLAYHELAEATGEGKVKEASLYHHRMVMEKFLRADRDLVVEFIGKNGTLLPKGKDTVCVPGHAIESMWFQIHIAKTNRDDETIAKALKVIRKSLELGWDDVYGGISLAKDIDGAAPVAWPHHETKLWWPHTEALYATLLAYNCSGQPWCLEWHGKIRKWSFDHFPSPFGEWKQKLTRDAKEITDTLVLPVKDPFHLPRALIYCILALDDLGNGL